MSAITVDGDLVHYEVLGRGRPVVLVHGWVGSWRYWIPTMQKLHLKFRVYAVDLLGFGESARSTQRYTIDYQVRVLHQMMNQLAITKAAFVGHGLGALVLTEYAQRYSDTVVRMMLSSPPLFDPGDLATRIPAGQQILLTQQNVPAPMRAFDKTVLNRTSGAQSTSTSDATIVNDRLVDRGRLRDAALARAAAEMAQRESTTTHTKNPTDNPLYRAIGSLEPRTMLDRTFKKSESHYERLLPDVSKADPTVVRKSSENYDAGRVLDILRAIKAPLVLTHGTDDPFIPEPTEEVINYLMGDKDKTVLPFSMDGVRHFPMLESDEYNQIISGFLEQENITTISTKARWRRRSR